MTKELAFSVTLADCDVQTFRAGGKGGQNQNKRDTGVRIIHRDSGARGESREERSQLQNKRTAFKRMTETKEFKLWLKHKLGVTAKIEAEVQRSLDNPKNLVIESKDERGRWVEGLTHDNGSSA